jgi:NAD(P)-dependent dehydrogenase (short-subunit alcohol dehydrogenase family)
VYVKNERQIDVQTLEDSVVIITGGSSGIGRATALSFASRGARVLITGRRAASLDETAKGQPNIKTLVADTAQPAGAPRTIARAIELWGRLDVLVNNAGAGAIMPLADATARRMLDIFAVNVFGPSLLAKEALPHLKETKGSIINISSTYGSKVAAALSHYGASKAALEYLTRSWALELAPARIRVNAVAVGPTETGALEGMMRLSKQQAAIVKQAEKEQIPLGRRGTPEDVSRWIVSLAELDSNWITGQIFAVDGGLSLI